MKRYNFNNKGNTLVGIIIVLVVVGLITAGLYYYLSKQIPEVSEMPEIPEKPIEEEITKPEEKVTPLPEEELSKEEIPPEEKIEEKPVVQKCTDGTLYGQCSTNKPKYCERGSLIDKCSICGCLEGMVCGDDNKCVKTGPQVIQISAGGMHSCALLSNKTVKCWGLNDFGQLGDRTKNNKNLPVLVQGINTAIEVGGGGWHTCVRLNTGRISCWGFNYYGALGDGTNIDSPIAVSVLGIETATQIEESCRTSCAVLSNGTIKCWGDGAYGMLGDETNVSKNIPVTVKGINTAKQASPKTNSVCAVLDNGTVKCWGRNEAGQVGDGTTETPRMLPALVLGIDTAVQVTTGNIHACALLRNGTVKCWGSNGVGQLGNGTYTNSSTPVLAKGIEAAIQVQAGNWHTCALLSNGTVKCWGRNGILGRERMGGGLLGDGVDGATVENRNIPVEVEGINTAIQISVGDWHACALLSSGAVKCWGSNEYGQLGNGTNIDTNIPVSAVGL